MTLSIVLLTKRRRRVQATSLDAVEVVTARLATWVAAIGAAVHVSRTASLAITPRHPVVHLRRLRCADEQPIAIESTILLGACADAVMTADLTRGSLHEALARAGFALRRGTGTITAAAATAEDARLLSIRVGDPLLIERRVISDSHGRPIEATESRYPADRYALDVRFDVEAPDHSAERARE